MQGLVDQLQVVSAEDKKTLESITENMVATIRLRDEEAKNAKQAKLDHIHECLNMVRELGVAKNSPLYFAATKLFKSTYNRHIFCHFDTPEDKLAFLQQVCQQ
jgi:hypothetical protein